MLEKIKYINQLSFNAKLKLLIISFIITFYPFKNLKSQYSTPVISELNIWILSLSVNYSYFNGYYLPSNIPVGSNFDLYANALGALHERYYANKKLLSNEYFKLRDLQLINNENVRFLTFYRNQRMDWLWNAINHWDLADNRNAKNILNYCCDLYKIPEIKAEIELLNKCNNEISTLKYSQPYDYYNTKRYRAISKVLDKLAKCHVSEISSLNWEYFEMEEDRIVKKEQSKRYIVSKTLNVRTFASTDANIIATLRLGDEVELVEQVNQNWSKVNFWYFNYSTYSNTFASGYVYNSYISR